jgi:Phage integrase family
MRRAGETDHGLRLRALLVVLWRAGLRIGEAMALTEPDLDPGRGSILVRQGKGGKRHDAEGPRRHRQSEPLNLGGSALPDVIHTHGRQQSQPPLGPLPAQAAGRRLRRSGSRRHCWAALASLGRSPTASPEPLACRIASTTSRESRFPGSSSCTPRLAITRRSTTRARRDPHRTTLQELPGGGIFELKLRAPLPSR